MGLRCFGIFEDFGNNEHDGCFSFQGKPGFSYLCVYILRSLSECTLMQMTGSTMQQFQFLYCKKFRTALFPHVAWTKQLLQVEEIHPESRASKKNGLLKALEGRMKHDLQPLFAKKMLQLQKGDYASRLQSDKIVLGSGECCCQRQHQQDTEWCLNLLTTVFLFVFSHLRPLFCLFSPRWWQSMARIPLRPCGGSYKRIQTAVWCCWHGAIMSMQTSRRLFKQRRLPITGQLL